MDYLADRFAGRSAPNTCTVPPDPAAASAAPCAAPRARITRSSLRATRRRVALRGTATAPCDPRTPSARGRVARVTVSIARVAGRGCRHLGADGRLRARRSCPRPIALRARGTKRWTLRRKAALRPGRYRIWVRATDDAGRRQALPRRAGATFRVR
jgi:hypothetical protein